MRRALPSLLATHAYNTTKVKGKCAVFLRSKKIIAIFIKIFFDACKPQRPYPLSHY
jgi:hypothetical protein